ncbi:MAG: PLP-dependent aminotransferase family protein [Sumerlaeia bacterium]
MMNAKTDLPKYEQIARNLEGLIENGTYKVGEKLPSIRQLSADWRVSVTTVTEAYRMLENKGLAESRPQSGFFVLYRPKPVKEPREVVFNAEPIEPLLTDFMVQMMQDMYNPSFIPLGGAVLPNNVLPTRQMQQAANTAGRRFGGRVNQYQEPAGAYELRSAIAKRLVGSGLALHPDEVVITNGCHEAIVLALTTVTEPGDLVVVESPGFYITTFGAMNLGRKLLEVNCSPKTGLSLEALEFAIKNHPVKAVITVPNFQNPLGCETTPEHKKQLVELCEREGVVLIEDDIYGELSFDKRRPQTCKSFDRTGNVILCSSFSKTAAPGYRVGWVVPGKQLNALITRKMLLNISTSALPQFALSVYLEEEGYDHHLRKVRKILAERVGLLAELIRRYFPAETRLSRPKGGMVLWLEFPRSFDSIQVYREALAKGICIAPGAIFSQGGHTNHCLRFNASTVDESIAQHVEQLSQIVAKQLK